MYFKQKEMCASDWHIEVEYYSVNIRLNANLVVLNKLDFTINYISHLLTKFHILAKMF